MLSLPCQKVEWLNDEREEFRKVYEELLQAHLKGMPELPLEIAMESVDKILKGHIRFDPDELNREK